MIPFAAAIPQPVHQLAGSMLATGIRDALLASSFKAHMMAPPSQPKAEPEPMKEPSKPRRGRQRWQMRVTCEEARLEEVARVADLVGNILDGVIPKALATSPRQGRQAARFGMMATLSRVKESNARELAPIIKGLEKGARDRARERARKASERAKMSACHADKMRTRGCPGEVYR